MTDERKDLPPVNSPNFLEKVREALGVYLGNRGNGLDRGLTLRDLTEAGIVQLRKNFGGSGGTRNPIGGLGSLILDASEYVVDLTPPPTPTGFAATSAISNIMVECGPPTYPQGNGHSRSKLYGATWSFGPRPVFADAKLLTEFQGTVAAHATNPATTWHLWLTWVTVDGVESITPAGGINGLVTRTGEDVALLLKAMAGAVTESELYGTLNARIDLLDGGVAQPALPYPLAALAAMQDSANQKVRRDLDSVGSNLLDSVVKISHVNQTVHDAGININPATGLVEIYGLELAKTHLNTVDVRLNAAEGNINLKASTTYVDNAIAIAVLDPSQIPVFGQLEARIGTAEVDISSLESAVTLKASNLDLSTSNVRITTAETSIDALNGQIANRVTSGDFAAVTGGLDARVGSAETIISALGDTSSIIGLVQQSSERRRSDNETAEILLRQLLNGVRSKTQADIALSFAREELYAHTEDGIFAEATKRTELAVAVGSSLATLTSQQNATATALSAETSSRLTLANTTRNNQAAIAQEYITKTDIDGAISRASSSLRAYADKAQSDATAQAGARVDSLETSQLGYATLVGSSAPFDGDGVTLLEAAVAGVAGVAAVAAVTEVPYQAEVIANPDAVPPVVGKRAVAYVAPSPAVAAVAPVTARPAVYRILQKKHVDAWNASPAGVGKQAVWRVGLPLATAIKQVGVTVNGVTGTIEDRMVAVAKTADSIYLEKAVRFGDDDSVVGYGLSSTVDATTGAVTKRFGDSKFIVNVDKFAISTPKSSIPLRGQNLDGSVKTVYALGDVARLAVDDTKTLVCVQPGTQGGAGLDMSQAIGKVLTDGEVKWQIASRIPFSVAALPFTYDGVNVPAGALMDGAYIRDATITNAKIANAAIDDAKIANLSAAKITTGTLDAARIATGSLDAKIANLDTAVITSGFINAARINTASIASANIGAAQITSGFIDSARINTASIANVLIDTAQIASAAITTANIGDLQVNTLQIANNAVTVPMSATGVDINNMTSAWVNSATVTGDFRGSGVVLSMSAVSDWTSVIEAGANEVDWRLLRDGIELRMWRGLAQQNSAHSLCSMFSDTPSAGSHSYTVQFRTSASSGATYWIRTPTIIAIGYRK